MSQSSYIFTCYEHEDTVKIDIQTLVVRGKICVRFRRITCFSVHFNSSYLKIIQISCRFDTLKIIQYLNFLYSSASIHDKQYYDYA